MQMVVILKPGDRTREQKEQLPRVSEAVCWWLITYLEVGGDKEEGGFKRICIYFLIFSVFQDSLIMHHTQCPFGF